MQAKIVLVALPQADGRSKPRPALVLCEMPPFQDVLLAGISSQLQQAVIDFDEIIYPDDADFTATGYRLAGRVSSAIGVFIGAASHQYSWYARDLVE